MKELIKIVMSMLIVFGVGVVRADVVVIVSAKSPITALTKDQVSDLFLGKVATFPDGGQAVPIEQPDSVAALDEFHSKVTGKTNVQIKSHWSRMVFTGKGSPPKEVPNSSEVKKLVAANPNMIGYVEKSALDGSVKAVLSP